jgi:hypothetical protein
VKQHSAFSSQHSARRGEDVIPRTFESEESAVRLQLLVRRNCRFLTAEAVRNDIVLVWLNAECFGANIYATA